MNAQHSTHSTRDIGRDSSETRLARIVRGALVAAGPITLSRVRTAIRAYRRLPGFTVKDAFAEQLATIMAAQLNVPAEAVSPMPHIAAQPISVNGETVGVNGETVGYVLVLNLLFWAPSMPGNFDDSQENASICGWTDLPDCLRQAQADFSALVGGV